MKNTQQKTNLGTSKAECKYSSFEKFVDDCKLIANNVFVFNDEEKGQPGTVYELAEQYISILDNKLCKVSFVPLIDFFVKQGGKEREETL